MTNQRLTDEEIFNIQFCWGSMEDPPWLEWVKHKPFLPYLSALKDHRVIEIGPGKNPISRHFPCREYIPAHGYYPNDGLTVLRKEKDASAVVFSLGVFDSSILMSMPGNIADLAQRYIEELAGEVRRVMTPFSVIVGLHAGKYMGTPDIDIGVPEYGGVYLAKKP